MKMHLFPKHINIQTSCVGHKLNKNMILNQINAQNFAKVWMFEGPEGVGKLNFAFFLTSYLLTNSPEEKQYIIENVFQSNNINNIGTLEKLTIFKQLTEIGHPDLLTIEEKDNNISIESIREIKDFTSLSLSYSKYRVIVINNAHKLNLSSTNYMLKLLEESSPHNIFIFVSKSTFHLPNTLLSRCQRMYFSYLTEEESNSILNYLNEDYNKIMSNFFYHLYGGSPGTINKLLQYDFLKIHQTIIKSLKNKTLKTESILEIQKFLLDEKITTSLFHVIIYHFLYLITLYKINPSNMIVKLFLELLKDNNECKNDFLTLAKNWQINEIIRSYEMLIQDHNNTQELNMNQNLSLFGSLLQFAKV